MVLFSE
jgi:cullin 1